MSDAEKLPPNAPTWKLALILAITVIVLWSANLIVVYCWPERGTFGDMFGAVNALFTGLAFAAVIYAILIQRHEVGLLKDELDRSKKIMEAQQELASTQIAAQQKQQFEATFFNLLKVFNDLVDGMSLGSSSHEVRGRAVFPCVLLFVPATGTKYDPDVSEFEPPKCLPDNEQPTIEERYELFYSSHSGELGHYFRTLFNLFKVVQNNLETDDDRKVYTNIIRAQISNDEAMVLFLNGLTEQGKDFKPLLERFSVLKNVDQKHDIFERSTRKSEYAEMAFGKGNSPE